MINQPASAGFSFLEVQMRDAKACAEAAAALTVEQLAEVADQLSLVSNMLRMVNSGLQMLEAVEGRRLIEPRNHLEDDLKLLFWAEARLRGVTSIAPPQSEQLRQIATSPRAS